MGRVRLELREDFEFAEGEAMWAALGEAVGCWRCPVLGLSGQPRAPRIDRRHGIAVEVD